MGFVTRVTRRVRLVDQGLLNLSEHICSPRFLVGYVLLDILLSVVFCIDTCLYRYVFVFLPIYFWVLYCLPFFRLTAFEYPFGITMRFLSIRKVKHVLMFVDLILHLH
jgi:hypothetical protein